MINLDKWKLEPQGMSPLSLQPNLNPDIKFMAGGSDMDWIMRISKSGVEVNPKYPMDEIAAKVIECLDGYIKGLVSDLISERDSLKRRLEQAEQLRDVNDWLRKSLIELRKLSDGRSIYLGSPPRYSLEEKRLQLIDATLAKATKEQA